MFNFPWTNFHELNLDWILSVVKEAKAVFDNGRSDIDYAVSTADEAKTIATQAAEASIADNSISTVKIQNGAVTNAKLATNSVTTANIVDRTIIGNDIAENTIESYNIKNGTIIGADIASNTIASDNLAAGAVTNAKISDNGVTTPKIANLAVTLAKLAADAKTSGGEGYVKFTDGTMIAWGSTLPVTSGTQITFPQPFSVTPAILFAPIYNTLSSVYCIYSAGSASTSGFTMYAYDVTTNTWSTSTTLRCHWVAIGKWN